jgi:hypothetical protein
MRSLLAVVALAAATAFPAQAAAGPQKRLNDARQRWADTGYRNYHFLLDILRFRADNDPYRLTVRHGKAVDPPPEVGRVTTVPRLFGEIQRAIDEKYDSFSVAYGKRGLPRRVYLNPSDRIADEETTYLASHLNHDTGGVR